MDMQEPVPHISSQADLSSATHSNTSGRPASIAAAPNVRRLVICSHLLGDNACRGDLAGDLVSAGLSACIMP